MSPRTRSVALLVAASLMVLLGLGCALAGVLMAAGWPGFLIVLGVVMVGVGLLGIQT